MNDESIVIIRNPEGATPVGQAAHGRLFIWRRVVDSVKQFRLRLFRLRLGRCLAMTLLWLLIMSSSKVFAASMYQDANRFTYGFKRVLIAPFQIPYRILQGTARGPFILGTVGGALQGTFSTVGNLMTGAFDMAAASAPYAKYAVFI